MVIGIVGLGLIGGSLALRLSQNHTVWGVDPDRAAADYALKTGAVSRITDYKGLKGCDAVFVCAPVEKTAACMKLAFAAVGDTAVLTDVASVKGALPRLEGARVVGGHPMAGTEFSGIAAAKPHLFENAYYVLVRYPQTDARDFALIERLVEELGARPVEMTAEEHDRQVAEISHMPHLVAYALATVPDRPTIAGTGFYDMTRIARSDPAFWRKVLQLNRENTLSALNAFRAALDDMAAALESGEDDRLQALLTAGRDKRVQLENARPYLEEYVVHADIRDEVGALERISGLLAADNINVSSLSIVNSREGVGGALRLGFKTEDAANRAAVLLKKRGYL